MTAGGLVWIEDTVGHPVGAELTRGEAEQVTARIKAFAGITWVLLYEAHERKAHKALGYASWTEYVAAEFDMSRSRSYQLISQAKVVMEIAAAVSPDGDIDVPVPERTARDLIEADAVEEAAGAAADAVSTMVDKTGAEKSAAAGEAVEQTRWDAVARMKERKAREAAEKAAREADGQNVDGEITAPREDGSEPREDAGGSADAGASDPDEGVGASPAPAPSDPDDGYRKFIDTALVRWCDVRQMDPDRVREVATTEQRDLIASNLLATREWCDRMQEAIESRPDLKAVSATTRKGTCAAHSTYKPGCEPCRVQQRAARGLGPESRQRNAEQLRDAFPSLPTKEEAICCIARRDDLGRLPVGFCSPSCLRRRSTP